MEMTIRRQIHFLIFATSFILASGNSTYRGYWLMLDKDDDFEYKISEPGSNASKLSAEFNCSSDQGELANLGDVAAYFINFNISGQFWFQNLTVDLYYNKSLSKQYRIGVISNSSNTKNDCTLVVVKGDFIGLKISSCDVDAGFICRRRRGWLKWSEWSNCSSSCFGNQTRSMLLLNNTRVNETRPCNMTKCFKTTVINTTTKIETTTSFEASTEFTTFPETSTLMKQTTTEEETTSTSTTSTTKQIPITPKTTPIACPPHEWSFDGGSFMIGFILVLLPSIALGVKFYLLRKKLKSTDAPSKHHYHDIDIDKGVNGGDVHEMNDYNADRKDFNVRSISDRPPHYENVTEGSMPMPSSGNETEHNPYEPVHHGDSDEDEDGYITKPASVPQDSGKYDGYENPLSIKRANINTDTTSGYVNKIGIEEKKPTTPMALKPPTSKPALKPLKPLKTENIHFKNESDKSPLKPQIQVLKPVAKKPPMDLDLGLKNGITVKSEITDQNPFKVALKPIGKSSPITEPKNVGEKTVGNKPQHALKPVTKTNKVTSNSPKPLNSVDNIADARKALTPVKK